MGGWPTLGVSRVDFEVQNVVASVDLHQNIDLLSIGKFFRNVEYRPEKFPGLVFRMKRPKTATLIFSTGKMVCAGAKSEKMARSAVRKVVRELKKGGMIILRSPKIVIQNVVATAYLGEKVDLAMAATIMDNVMYEPEQFPGLIYRMKEPKAVLLVFHSGKMVITGAKKENGARKAAEKMLVTLREEELFLRS